MDAELVELELASEVEVDPLEVLPLLGLPAVLELDGVEDEPLLVPFVAVAVDVAGGVAVGQVVATVGLVPGWADVVGVLVAEDVVGVAVLGVVVAAVVPEEDVPVPAPAVPVAVLAELEGVVVAQAAAELPAVPVSAPVFSNTRGTISV